MSRPRTPDPSPPGRILVVAALIRSGGRLLLSQRRPDQSWPLSWELPGGKVEPGEAPEAALRREIQEELGCEVAVQGIYEAVFHPYPEFDLLMLVYRAELVRDAPSPRQVHAVRWFRPEELPALDVPPADVPLLERLTAEARRSR